MSNILVFEIDVDCYWNSLFIIVFKWHTLFCQSWATVWNRSQKQAGWSLCTRPSSNIYCWSGLHSECILAFFPYCSGESNTTLYDNMLSQKNFSEQSNTSIREWRSQILLRLQVKKEDTLYLNVSDARTTLLWWVFLVSWGPYNALKPIPKTPQRIRCAYVRH